ncbi:MAG: VIT and VWA domain-containing protein [Pirellulales bacterium]|nr:VIT and VWA domain-containing protein [Pirellulales bacterium]
MNQQSTQSNRRMFLQGGLAAALGGTVLVRTQEADACFVRSPQPVQVWLDHIDVKITDQVAVKTYDCTFLNPNPRAVVGGTCYMELEPGARVSDLVVVVNGKKSAAEILDVKRSNKVFTEIVETGGSPALLEYFGNQLIQTKVPNIPPRGTVTVKLQYTTVLDSRNGLVRLQMLNTNPKADLKPLKKASVRVAIDSKTPLKNVYSPTHPIKIVEDTKHDVVVEWSEVNYLPQAPFVLYYQTAKERIAASLLTHREHDEDGYFMLMLSPTIGSGNGAIDDTDILPKDVVFCVDTSGSMLHNGKMQQASEALTYCLENLRDGDRFNVVDFGTGLRQFQEGTLATADDATRRRALRYVEEMRPRGGTAIDEALKSSLEMLNQGDRLKMIVLITDGRPTIGERSPEAILKKMRDRNKQDVRVFAFGAGHDVNTRLLDFLAVDHRGEAEYVLPKENIADKISGFYDRVGSPILTDLGVEFEGIRTFDVFPRKVRDVYRGEQVILYGRFRGEGKRTVRLTGKAGASAWSSEYTLDFPGVTPDDRQGFVPRLWAGEMVDYLLDQIRNDGMDNTELIKEVTRLAKRHGIVTPYTSFLMVADTCNQPLAQQVAAFNSRNNSSIAGGLGAANWGKAAVENSWKQSRYKSGRARSGNATFMYQQAADGLAQEKRRVQTMAAIRYVGSRTFYNSGGVWYDSRFDNTQKSKLQTVNVGDANYMKLLTEKPNSAKYLSQGNVVVNIDGQWYRAQPRKG